MLTNNDAFCGDPQARARLSEHYERGITQVYGSKERVSESLVRVLPWHPLGNIAENLVRRAIGQPRMFQRVDAESIA